MISSQSGRLISITNDYSNQEINRPLPQAVLTEGLRADVSPD
jgi:hypothetical protein